MFTLTVKFYAKEGKEDELMKTIRDATAIVREKEKDTLVYTAFRNMKNPSEFFFFEQYTNREAWAEVHDGMPYIKEAVEKISGLITGGMELSEYESIT